MSAIVSDVRSMSDEELRVKVAELCGYTFKDEGSRYPDEEDWQKYKAVYHGEGFIGLAKPNWIPVPNYPKSLDACHDMEKALTPSEDEREFNEGKWVEYCANLARVCGYNPHDRAMFSWDVFHSTARQRCEAFILTMETAVCSLETLS